MSYISSEKKQLELATGTQAFLPAWEPMELLETPYKSRLPHCDFQLLGDSTHFVFVLQTAADEICSKSQGLRIWHLCQVNKGKGAAEGRAVVRSRARFSLPEIKLPFQLPENSQVLPEVTTLGRETQ